MTAEDRIAELEAELAAEREGRARSEGERDAYRHALELMTARTSTGSPVEDVAWPRIRIRRRSPEEQARREEEERRRAAESRRRHEEERAHRLALKRSASRVYFIQEQGGERMVKIGYTARPVEVRLMELQAIRACPLVVLAAAPGMRQQEGELHLRFSGLRVTGEWFRPGEELMSYIAAVRERGVL